MTIVKDSLLDHAQLREDKARLPTTPHRVMVSPKFVIVSLMSSMLLGFAAGTATRLMLFEGQSQRKTFLLGCRKWIQRAEGHLTSLLARDGQQIPSTLQSTKKIDTDKSVSSSSWLDTSRHLCAHGEDGAPVSIPNEESCSGEEPTHAEEEVEVDDDGGLYPGRAHLMADFKHRGGSFIKAEQRLKTQASAVYHEALVHPALFTHSNPKRVSIIGGAEAGGALREVLKHNTIEEAVMIVIDTKGVNLSREDLPEWGDFSNLIGSDSLCVQDPRATIYNEDPFAWFVNRYGDSEKCNIEKMDAIIMDAVDPESDIPFSRALYSNDAAIKVLYNSLSDEGILVMQLGKSPEWFSPDETHSENKNRTAAIRLLERVGFESIQAYEEASWTYVVAFKVKTTRKQWHANAAQFDLEIQKRGVQMKLGVSPFRYFDGSTMVSYQLPSRAMETVFCRRKPMPEECLEGKYWFSSDYPNAPLSSFEVNKSGAGDNAGRGVFAKLDLTENMYLSAETSSHAVLFMPSTVALIEALVKEPIGDELEVLHYYMHGYGFMSRGFGESEVFVDSALLTFVNHGCNGTYNIGEVTTFDESTVSTDAIPDELSGKGCKGTSTFNPMVDRHLRNNACMNNRAIKAGEEILDNYLAFFSNDEDWAQDVINLRNQCSGLSVGEVTEYEANQKTNHKEK